MNTQSSLQLSITSPRNDEVITVANNQNGHGQSTEPIKTIKTQNKYMQQMSQSVCLCLSFCLSVCIYLSLSVSFCLSVSLSVCMYVCVYLSLSVCLILSFCLSVYICLCLSVFVFLSVCLSVCLCLSFCMSVSVCMFVSVCLSVSVADSRLQSRIYTIKVTHLPRYLREASEIGVPAKFKYSKDVHTMATLLITSSQMRKINEFQS